MKTILRHIILLVGMLLMSLVGVGQQILTIHDGTTTNSYVPVYGFYTDAYLKCEFVYPASELSVMTGGTISSMTFYLSSPASDSWGSANFQVFMKEVSETTVTNFSGPGTIVYEGSLDGTQSTMTITFTNPYLYNGGNLLIGFYNTVEGSYKSSSFYGETVNGASVQGYNYSDLNSITETQRNFLPKVTFGYTKSCQEYNIGEGTSTTYVTPYNSLWGYSFVEQIYTADEIGQSGTIEKIYFNMQSTTSQTNAIKVYMIHTHKTSFLDVSDYEQVSVSDIVYDGTYTFNQGWNEIELTNPFVYDDNYNLIIGFHEYTSGYSTRYFYYTSTTDNTVVTYHSDGVNPDPYNLSSYSGNKYVSSSRANLKFCMILSQSQQEAENLLQPCEPIDNLNIDEVTANSATISWSGNACAGYNIVSNISNNCTIKLTAGNIWSDNTGYQMLLDADKNTYRRLFDVVGGITSDGIIGSGNWNDVNSSVYDEFEYKIPTNADGALSTTNVVFENSISINIPEGIYDWCITNPTPEDRMWIGNSSGSNFGNVGGRQNDYKFVGGNQYEFIVSSNGDGEDKTDVIILPLDENYITTNNNTYTFTNLQPETTYTFYIQSDCETNVSEWQEITFTTTYLPLQFLETVNEPVCWDFEDIELLSLPSKWTNEGDRNWTVGTGDYSGSTTGAHSGSRNLLITHTNRNDITYLCLPLMNLSNIESGKIIFWFINRSWAGDIDELDVCYRINSGNWISLFHTADAHSGWTEQNVNLVPGMFTNNVQIGFKFKDNYGYGVGLDDICLELYDAQNHLLPISLLSFTTSPQPEYNLVQWTTATEKNNDLFILERSEDAVVFDEVYNVSGAGNSMQPIDYEFRDYCPLPDITYYRLTQVDYDGSKTTSEIISCIRTSEKMSNWNYFTHTYEGLQVNSSDSPVEICCHDVLGRLIYTYSLPSHSNTIIRLNPPYFVTVYENGVPKATEKVFK